MVIGRHFLHSIALAPTALLAACAAQLRQPAEPFTKNIVFIAIDDLRNWINCVGDHLRNVHTFKINELAAVSIRYLNAYMSLPGRVAAWTSVMFFLSPANYRITGLSWERLDPDFWASYSNPEMIKPPEKY